MLRIALVAAMLATPVLADEELTKQQSCQYYADIVDAIRLARLDRVPEKKLEETIAASDPEWPESFNKIIPALAPEIYKMKRRDLKNDGFADAWMDICLQQ